MTASVYVLTCERMEDPWKYLQATLEQLDAEQLAVPRRVIFCDGVYTGPRPPGWNVVEWQRPDGALPGNKLPYFAMLEEASKGGGDALIFEDDIKLCRNALRRMATFPIPADCDWVQFFSPHVLTTLETMPGLWRPPSRQMFTQALKFSGPTLAKLASWRQQDPEFGKFNASDDCLNLAVQRLGLRYAVHAPDLVQHMGAVSAANPDQTLGNGRVSVTWSERVDALSLYARDDLYR